MDETQEGRIAHVKYVAGGCKVEIDDAVAQLVAGRASDRFTRDLYMRMSISLCRKQQREINFANVKEMIDMIQFGEEWL
ncbi:hypothetical protein [Gordonia sp. CNJ-863]|uniref:hypothetical protein n=1 Tax=Gordonia sp. CNJ-863 TaxID=1904963 RepID=UPI0011151CAD|nr:hypothetical protein [Gordonia sp. CNJ-863]